MEKVKTKVPIRTGTLGPVTQPTHKGTTVYMTVRGLSVSWEDPS